MPGAAAADMGSHEAEPAPEARGAQTPVANTESRRICSFQSRDLTWCSLRVPVVRLRCAVSCTPSADARDRPLVSNKACRGDFRGAGVLGAVGDLLCRCALLRSAIKKRFGCKCVRFGIPFSRDPRNPDVGKLLEQGARFRVQGSDVLLANLRAPV